MDQKQCSRCGKIKPLEGFGKDKSKKDGRRPDCKECSRKAAAAWRASNQEKLRAQQAAYRAANPEKLRAKNAAWRKANKEKVRAYRSAWEKANPDKVMAQRAAWRAANPEKRAAQNAVSNAVAAGLIPQLTAGLVAHHWNYAPEYRLDVITLSIRDHNQLHALTKYDPERLIYLRNDTGEVLDTREKVEQLIDEIKALQQIAKDCILKSSL